MVIAATVTDVKERVAAKRFAASVAAAAVLPRQMKNCHFFAKFFSPSFFLCIFAL
jgi:hypothetical protein